MFLLSSSAVLGTYSFPPPFLRPLFGMNSLTHSPLTAAISLKQGEIRVSMLRDMVYLLKEVLRGEIQGLKVWPVYRSQVFSITGTYF